MYRDFVAAGPEAPVTELMRLFHTYQMRALPIVEEGRLLGIVTDADLFLKKKGLPHSRAKAPSLFGEFVNSDHLDGREDLGTTPAREVMCRRVVTIEEDLTVAEIALLMCDRHLHTVPVVRGDQIVGLARRYDVLAQIFGITEPERLVAAG